MGKHLEAKRLVLVEKLEPAWHVVAAIFPHEIGVRQQSLEIDAHLLAAFGARVAGKARAAVGDELVKIIGHRFLRAGRFVPHYSACAGPLQGAIKETAPGRKLGAARVVGGCQRTRQFAASAGPMSACLAVAPWPPAIVALVMLCFLSASPTATVAGLRPI